MGNGEMNPLALLLIGLVLCGAMFKAGLGDPIYFAFFLGGVVMLLMGIKRIVKK